MKTLPHKSGNMQALIVDDDLDICFLIGRILTQKNISNKFVTSLTDARQILKKQTFDLTFLDNQLPDGKGIGFVPYLKAKYPRLTIIMITAYANQNIRQAVKENKVDFFLPKPFHARSIYAIIFRLKQIRKGLIF